MKSDAPKVLHEVCGRPMLAWVLSTCLEAGCDRLLVVVGHKAESVSAEFAEMDWPIEWVRQSPQLGTGHAVMVCRDHLADLSGPVLVIAGDGPLIEAETLRQLIETHQQEQAACTLATSILPDPGAYGRILRDEAGRLVGIVEHIDADQRQRQINEVNVSLYCFEAACLREVIGQIDNDNAKGEYYITDALGLLKSQGKKIAAVAAVPPEDVISINTPEELQTVDRIMAKRLQRSGERVDA